MRLLYVHGTPIDCQSANMVQVLNMCHAFAQCGVEVALATAAPRDESVEPDVRAACQLGQDATFDIVTYRKYTLAGGLNVLGRYLGVRRVLKHLRADLCYVRDPLSLHLAVDAGWLTVFESHSRLLHNRLPWLARWWAKDVLAKAKSRYLVRFVAISQALARFWLDQGVPKQKLVVLHDGFRSDIFQRPSTQEGARARIGLPSDRRVVVYAGGLHGNRGVHRILSLARELPKVCFVVVGGPEERRAELERQSRDQGVHNIRWQGWVAHAAVADYLFAADVLLMMWTWDVPHIRDFSPLKMFEYMAAGRIIVGEAFPTIGEVLTDGETAFLADPDSFDDLCRKLRHALRQEYPSTMATRARELALQKYTWTARARHLLASLEGLL